MPTEKCNQITHWLMAIFGPATDRAAYVVAAGAASIPMWWSETIKGANETAIFIAPTMAGVFLFGKIVHVVIQIYSEFRKLRDPAHGEKDRPVE